MIGILRTAFVLGMLWTVGGGPFNFLGVSADYIDPSYDYWQAIAKRSGFWSPHPSDYNPMRRPNVVLRPNSKRGLDEVPYHPLAKGVSLIQRLGLADDDYINVLVDESDSRLKKHIWPANLMYRLGSAGPSPNEPPRKEKYVPSVPGSGN